MKNRKTLLIAAFVGVGVSFGLLTKFLKEETPFKEGSGQWVGYTAAEANGFTGVKECTDDPETKDDAEFVEGCEAWINKR